MQSIYIEKDIIVMGSEPTPKLSLEDAMNIYLSVKDEQSLAVIYAVVNNKAWWLAHDIDDYEESSKEYFEQCKLVDDWFEIASKIEEDIFEILRGEGVVVPETGIIKVLQPFMDRNGYFYGTGWWIIKEDKLIEKMVASQGKYVTILLCDGKVLNGYADVFEKNNDVKTSICFTSENGESHIVEERNLEGIIIRY